MKFIHDTILLPGLTLCRRFSYAFVQQRNPFIPLTGDPS